MHQGRPPKKMKTMKRKRRQSPKLRADHAKARARQKIRKRRFQRTRNPNLMTKMKELVQQEKTLLRLQKKRPAADEKALAFLGLDFRRSIAASRFPGLASYVVVRPRQVRKRRLL